MATTTTKIKQEHLNDDYPESILSSSSSTYARYGTPITSSPTGVDGTTTPTEESQEMIPASKRRRCSGSLVLQNGCRDDALFQPKCLSTAYEHYEGSHAARLLDSFLSLRLREELLDVVIVVDGKEIACHKIVLCCVSKYFADLLLASSNKHFKQVVNIHRTSYEIVRQLVDFAYTSRIDITESNIEPLFAAATLFRFTTVCDACIVVLRQKLSPTCCMSIRRFAYKQGCKELAERATRFAADNFEEVVASDEFKEVTLNELLDLISSSSLNVESEEHVYEAAMTWVQHDLTGRHFFLPQILEHVRLPLVKPQFLLDIVQANALIKGNKACEVFLDEARRFQLLADQRPLMQSCRTQPRHAWSVQKNEVLVAVGGLNKDKLTVSNCNYFNFPEPCAKQLATLKINQTAYSVTAVNNNIFVTGGAFHFPYKDVWMYIPSLNTWKQVAPMLEGRYLHASAALGGHLYVVGGHNGTVRLRSVERYNPDSNVWNSLKPMLTELSSPCAVACDGFLYLIGGARGPLPSDMVCDVQYFNPVLNVWKAAAPLPQPERGALGAAINGTIYVMGQHRSVRAYSRQSNVWVSLRKTNGGHLHGAATVHRGKLYVAGGLHGNSFINGTVEMYDQLHDNWQVVGTLHEPVYAQGFVSIFMEHVKKRPT